MDEEEMEEFDGAVVVGQKPTVMVPLHISKRSLRNKVLSINFDEKNLRDFVTGFQKRKKKRRKEAQKQLHEKERKMRIEARKKPRGATSGDCHSAATVSNPFNWKQHPGGKKKSRQGGSTQYLLQDYNLEVILANTVITVVQKSDKQRGEALFQVQKGPVNPREISGARKEGRVSIPSRNPKI